MTMSSLLQKSHLHLSPFQFFLHFSFADFISLSVIFLPSYSCVYSSPVLTIQAYYFIKSIFSCPPLFDSLFISHSLILFPIIVFPPSTFMFAPAIIPPINPVIKRATRCLARAVADRRIGRNVGDGLDRSAAK